MTIFHVLKYNSIDLRINLKGKIPEKIFVDICKWSWDEGNKIFDQYGYWAYDKARTKKFKELLLEYEGPL